MKKLNFAFVVCALTLLLQLSAQAQIVRAKAWVWVDNPTAAGSTPNSSFQFNSSGNVNRVVRLGVGRHSVQFTGLNLSGGTAQVAAYGGSHFCNVESWGGQQVTVRCYTAAGVPTDGRFTLSYYSENRGFPSENAYLWTDQEFAANYLPSATYQWNSSGALNSVRRLGTGLYEAFLPGVNEDAKEKGGTVQVSAYGSTPRHANVQSWWSGQNGTFVRVQTFDTNGNPADTKFTLGFMTDVAIGTNDFVGYLNMYGAFLWANQPSATDYAPEPNFQLNNAGNIADTRIRYTAGSGSFAHYYQASLPVLKPFNRSTALVSAYGNERNYCNVQSWGSNGTGGTQVNVQCFNAAGQPVKSYFTLLYLTDETLLF